MKKKSIWHATYMGDCGLSINGLGPCDYDTG